MARGLNLSLDEHYQAAKTATHFKMEIPTKSSKQNTTFYESARCVADRREATVSALDEPTDQQPPIG
jgi:hypothetical protein